MKAMRIKSFGGPDVFEEVDEEKPEPKANQLLVKVHATSINPVDFKLRQSGSWAGLEPPVILGYDAAGVVEEIGEGVDDFEVGDEVYYTPEIFGNHHGTYAEYNAVNADIVALKPENLSFQEAASVPLAGGTAYDAIIRRGFTELGETVLIHGVGGVGSFAVQYAVAAGAQVFAVCSDYMVDQVKEYGAEPINYKEEDFVDQVNELTDGNGVDLVVDTVGGDTLSKCIPLTKRHGRMVSIVGTNTGFQGAGPRNITVHFLFLDRERVRLEQIGDLIKRGQVKPLIDSVMDLSEVADAHRKLEKGGVKGKIVLKVSD